jgi:hypothetical protein
VARRHGGGRARWGDRSRGNERKCVCANARAGVLGTPGCARSPEEDGFAREQELARRRACVVAQRRAGSSNATWGTRVRDSTRSGGRRHGRGVTRGITGKQEVARDCYDGKQR